MKSQHRWQSQFRSIGPGQKMPSAVTVFPAVNLSPQNLGKNYITEKIIQTEGVRLSPVGEEWDRYDGTHGNKMYFDKNYMNEKVKYQKLLIKRDFHEVKGKK